MDKLKISEGVTVNLGNYQSYRVEIEYSKEFNPNTHNKDDVFNEIKDYLDKKLKERMKEKANAKITREN